MTHKTPHARGAEGFGINLAADSETHTSAPDLTPAGISAACALVQQYAFRIEALANALIDTGEALQSPCPRVQRAIATTDSLTALIADQVQRLHDQNDIIEMAARRLVLVERANG